MPNSYFQFKQFTIHQQECAMKVCTDACLFGAWVAAHACTHLPIKNILDIGAGTGLLSLMLAQKNTDSCIDAVEIDKIAAHQAEQNITNSSWAEKITVYNQPVQQFLPDKQYDLIISNPPFYEGDLKSGNTRRNIALHSDALNFTRLIEAAQKLITNDGVFAVLLPFARIEYFIQLAKQYQFYVHKKALVQQTPGHACFRGMLCFGKTEAAASNEVITIKEEKGGYSPAFAALLKDYYLQL